MIDISVEHLRKIGIDNWPALQRLVLAECPLRLDELLENTESFFAESAIEVDRLLKDGEFKLAVGKAALKFADGDLNIGLPDVFARAGLPWPPTPTGFSDLIAAAKARFG